jgi:membrane fusion protein (multidrug efflux system)
MLVAALLVAATARAQELECLIEPRSHVALSAPVEGLIEAVHVERGDRVEKGQVLVDLESSLERAGVAVARARAASKAAVKESDVRLAFAKRQHARHKDLADTEVIASQKLDEVSSSLEIAIVGREAARDAQELAALELQRAEALLERRHVKSPIDGLVVERILDPGEYAEKQAILEIVELDPLHVEMFVPLSSLGAVDVGDLLIVLPEAPIGGEYEARVTVVDPVVDAASGTFRVRLSLPNPEYALPAGVGCRVRLPEPETVQ